MHSRPRFVCGQEQRGCEGREEWWLSRPLATATSPMNAERYMRLRCDWPAPVPLYRLLVVLKR